MSINIYFANLGKYTEGELVGEWFSLPVDFEEVAQAIGLNANYEEYAIHDFEAPFHIGEYESLDKLNKIAEVFEGKNEIEIKALCYLVDNGYVNDFEEAESKLIEDCLWYDDCRDMGEVAEQYAEETGLLDAMPENLRYYFDFDALGRDMAIEGDFVELEYKTWMQVL